MLELWELQNRHKLEAFINEILRLFLNYLASAKSLVEQTRVAINEWYKDTSFFNEYQDQINARFKNNSLVGFVEDLRNYNLHYSLPITRATYSFHFDENQKGVGTLKHSFVLNKASLLTWSSWIKGKDYLIGSDADIDISEIADEYFKQITNFHLWIVNRIQELHKEDFLWLEGMRRKIINTMDEEERKDRGLD